MQEEPEPTLNRNAENAGGLGVCELTLITACTTKYDCVVSADRLLTLQYPSGRFGGEHDSLSNKNVVLIADDGVAVLGYTGAAYINGSPTDKYIAECLYGEDLPSAAFMGNRARVLGGRVSDRIFSMRRRSSFNWHGGLVTVLAAGFRNYRGWLVPFIISFDLGKEALGGEKMRLRLPPSLGGGFALSSVGASLSSEELEAAYAGSLVSSEGPTAANIAQFLIDITLRKAAVNQTVGRDVMLIHIDALHRLVTCKFSSKRRHEYNSAPQIDDVCQPIAFTPWVIGRSSFIGPSMMTASQPLQFQAGHWAVHLYGAEPEPGGLGPTLVLAGQHRMAPPASK